MQRMSVDEAGGCQRFLPLSLPGVCGCTMYHADLCWEELLHAMTAAMLPS